MSLTGFISYKRVGWTGQTPWNPTNLNIMDKGIKDNNDMIANLRSEVSALNSNITLTMIEVNFLSDYEKKEKQLWSGTYLYINSHINNFQIAIISLSNSLKTCNVYTIYKNMENDDKTTKISYDADKGTVTFDSSKSSCRGQLLKLSDRFANT